MVSIDENIDVDAIVDEASGGGSGVDIGGGPDPGDITVNVGGDDDDDGGGGGGGGGGSTGPGAGGTGIPGAPSDEQPDTSGGDGGGGVDVGPGGDVSTIDQGGPGGGGTGGGTQPPSATSPGDVRTQRIIDEARRDRMAGLADDLRDMAGGGGQADDLTSADIEQMRRDILAQRIRENTGGAGRASRLSSRDVSVTRAMAGPRPGDVTVEPGGITVPVPGDGPRTVAGQGLEVETAGEDAPRYTINDPRPNRGEFTGTKPEIARLIESITLEETRGLGSPQDVAVVETDSGLAVRQTFGGLQKQWLIGSLARDIGQQFQSDAATTARLSNLGAIRTTVEQQVESQRNLGRVDVSGGESPGDLRVNISGEPADVDLTMRPWGATGPLQVTGGPGAGDVQVGFGTPAGDFTVSPVFGEPGRFDVGLTESRVRQEAAFGFEQEYGVQLDPMEDIELTEEGARLTRSGQVALANAPEQFGDRQIRDAGDLPLIGGAVDWWADVWGREPYGVSDLPSGVDVDTELVATQRTGPGRQPTVLEQRATGVNVETFEEGTTVEEALTAASLSYSDFASEAGEFSTKLAGPSALADLAAAYGIDRSDSETATEASVRSAIELLNVPALGMAVKEAGEFAPYTARETAAGRLGISYDPARTRPTQLGGPVSAPITIEEEGVAPDVAEEAETSIREFETYARENPAEFAGSAAGSLVASAAIMGGAGLISPRLGAATRGIIQPGEEALGYGGYYTTRALASERWAQRLFPAQEPLIFSEEAAFMGARKLGAGTRRLLGRTRARSADFFRGEVETVTDTSPSSFEGFWNIEMEQERPGLAARIGDFRARVESELTSTDRGQLGPPKGFARGETERQEEATDVITAEDIARPRPDPDQGPFWDPTTRELEREGGESPVNPMRERARVATESEIVDTELESGVAKRVQLATLPFTETVAGVDIGAKAMQQFRIGQEPRARARVGVFGETLAETEQRLNIESEVAQETRVDTELDLETELKLFREFETEFETEGEFEFELELSGSDERESTPSVTRTDSTAADESVIGDVTGAGWINVYATALAGGGLAERAAAEDGDFGALPRPTVGQVDPDEDLRAGLEAVDRFFFGGSGSETAAETGGDADDDPWGLL